MLPFPGGGKALCLVGESGSGKRHGSFHRAAAALSAASYAGGEILLEGATFWA
jgi:ABC-type dipeptide/oligopeptide/nickel transport system ATPase component